MIVCPYCRTVNDEDVAFCTRCGRTLEPGPVLLTARRTTETPPPPIEIRSPPRRSRLRPFVILGTLVAGLVAGSAFLLLKPDPCKGTNFASENFGYCLSVPEGWTAEPARFGGNVTLDQFSPPRASATVVVEAVDLTQDADLQQWVDFVRQKDQDAGLIPGPASGLTLDGVDGQQWDVTVTSQAGIDFKMREVVVVRDSVGWRVTLNDVADGFETSTGSFQLMLDSWRFR